MVLGLTACVITISMFPGVIVEYEGSLWTEGNILWLSINRSFYQGNTVQVFMVTLVITSVYCRGQNFEHLFDFLRF